MNSFIFVIGAFVAGVSAQVETYVAGGKNLDYYEEANFMLSLRQGTKHICGAVAVSTKWAISTADCVLDKMSGMPKHMLTIRSGTLDRETGGYVQKVKKIRKHPQFNKISGEFNFALIMVDGVFPANVKAPRFPPCWTEPEEYSSASIYGWGKVDQNGEHSDVMKQGQVFIIPRSDCNSLTPSNKYESTRDAKLICAASAGVGTCVGDEGGALMVDDLLVGIATVGKSCADPYNPSVFGNIGNYNVRIWMINTARDY